MSSPSGPSWRGSSHPPAREGSRAWRRPGSGSGAAVSIRSRWLRGLLSVFSALIALASMALFVFLLFVPGCTQTQYGLLAPAPYSDGGMPPHPFAQQDREDFRASFSGINLADQLAQPAPSAAATAGGTPRGTLVLYVTALAGHSGDGVVIYSVDSGPDEPDGYLSLDRLWDYLRSLPREQKKILALDLARGPVDWRWGQLYRPVLGSGASQSESQGVIGPVLSSIPNLAVLTSAAPGELSWTSPILARSVFAEFLIRGLAGEADGSAGQSKDRRVTLDELHQFVLTHTHHWVSQNRDLRGQHPQLLISAERRQELLATVVTEVHSLKGTTSREASRTADGARLRQLEAVWELRDKWSAKDPGQWHPLGWRRLQEHLRRAEQWRIAGQPEGMEPHLQAAERAARDLEVRDQSQNPDLTGASFVAAGLSRRTAAARLPETDPPLPERQLQIAMQNFAPSAATPPLREASVQLRARAEQQAWLSFRTRLWTGSLLAEADRDRRLSEDLLFVGGAGELERSTSAAQSAARKLDQHERIARELAEAQRLHRQLLTELPDLAWWASQRMPVENLRGKAGESRRARLMLDYSQGIDDARFRPPSLSAQEQKLRDGPDDSALQQSEVDLLLLFELTRQLARLLDGELDSAPQFATSTDWRDRLQSLTTAINDSDRGFEALRARLLRHARSLIGAGGEAESASGRELSQTQYFHWLRLRNALQWSGLPAEVRRGLFADLEQSDRTLHANAQRTPVAATADWNGDDWSGIDGCWQGLWALQTLSLGAAETEMDQRWVLWKNAVVDSEKQPALLVQLGQSIRQEFRDRVDRAQPALASAENPESALRSLLAAERAVRTLHGYDAVLFSAERDPVRRLQSFELAAVCVAQAGRYLEDFWGKVTPDDREPWFVRAADQCLRVGARQNDLLSLPALKAAHEQAARRLQSLQAARLKLAPVNDVVDLRLASQRSTRITAEISPETPRGVAAVWLEEDADPGREILEFRPAGRRSITLEELSAEFTVRKQRAAAAGRCATLGVLPHLLFRGRYWEDADNLLQVDPCPPASIDWKSQPPAPTGEIIVNGVDRRDTIFILDCSLSMTSPINPKDPQGESRFQAARTTLTEAIRVLRDGPILANEKQPHVVGLMAYGHRAGAKNGDPNQTSVNTAWRVPIPSAVAEDWRNDFEILTPPDRLVDEQYQKILANLDTLQPFGQTPLLGALQSAARYFIDRRRGGVIVAICDGAYNDGFPDGPRYKAIQETLGAHPELSLHVVAFGVDEKADIDSLTRLSEQTRSKFYNAPSGPKLAQTIETVMKPRQYAVIREALPREEILASLGEPVTGRLPDTYQVRFPGLAQFSATIAGGERLQFDLDFAGNQLRHRRPQPLLFRRVQDSTALSTAEPTRFGYLKASLDRQSHEADFLFCLDRDDQLGIVARPAEMRIEVTPRGGRQRSSGEAKLAPGQSIPVWQISLHNWPADGQPEVQASWKMTRTEPDAALPLAASLKTPQSPDLPDWPEGALTVVAERQGGRVLVRLQGADDVAAGLEVADVRVELGRPSLVENRFLATPFHWQSTLYEFQRQVTYTFDVGDAQEIDDLQIALTSRSSLDRGARRLEAPLIIEKWDQEQ